MCLFSHCSNFTLHINFDGVVLFNQDLFFAHAVSLEQLKTICAALTECQGFNSHGWLKRNVEMKHELASTVLYVKHNVQEFAPSYVSPSLSLPCSLPLCLYLL